MFHTKYPIQQRQRNQSETGWLNRFRRVSHQQRTHWVFLIILGKTVEKLLILKFYII